MLYTYFSCLCVMLRHNLSSLVVCCVVTSILNKIIHDPFFVLLLSPPSFLLSFFLYLFLPFFPPPPTPLPLFVPLFLPPSPSSSPPPPPSYSPLPPPPPLQPGNPVTGVLHITDIHYDPLYTPGLTHDCGEPLCCRPPNAKGGPVCMRVCSCARLCMC